MFREFLLKELHARKPHIGAQDIAKFIIQAYTGPFHSAKQEHDIRLLSRKFKMEFTDKRESCMDKDIFLPLSDRSLRVNIIPFMLKYKSSMLLANIFSANFKYFDELFYRDLPIDEICAELDALNLKTDKICELIETFNKTGETPSHSKIYNEHFSPAYAVVLSPVIKEYISVL